MLFALSAVFPVSGRTSHTFFTGTPQRGWLSQGDFDELQGHGHVTKQHAKKNTSQCCSAGLGEAIHHLGVGSNESPERVWLSM